MLKFILNLFGISQISYLQKKSSQKLELFTKTIEELDQINDELNLVLIANSNLIEKIAEESYKISQQQDKNIKINTKLKDIFQ